MMDLEREANVSPVILPNEGGGGGAVGAGGNAVMTVAIYHPPILPFPGSRIQDDEVSSTIEPDEDIPPTKDSNMIVKDNLIGLNGEPPRKSFLLEVKSESELAILPFPGENHAILGIKATEEVQNDVFKERPEEYPHSEQSPSTSQPSPPEAAKPDPGDFLELTCVSFPSPVVVNDLQFPKPEEPNNDSSWNGMECSPNLFLDEEDGEPDQPERLGEEIPHESNQVENPPTVDTIVSKPQDAPNATAKKSNPPRIPEPHPAFPLKPCQIILKRCDDLVQGSTSRLSHPGNGFIFNDQISDNDMNRLRNLRRTAARQKQENPPPQKDKSKVERRGRPPVLKRLVRSPIKVPTENGTAPPSTANGNRGRSRRKRRGMPGSVRYSRYSKRKYKLKAELLKDTQSLNSGQSQSQVETDPIVPQVQVDNIVLEDELSMMDSCPSPNISEDSEPCMDDKTDNENDQDYDDPSSSSNIITAEQARSFVTAWVNTGDGEEESKPFQSNPSLSKQISTKSDPPTTPNGFGGYDIDNGEEGVEEDPEEVDTKPLLKCSTCSKTFDNPMTLQVHMRLHTGERPYKCKCCGEAFIHYTYLEYHYKNTHGESNPSTNVKSDTGPKKGKGRKLNGNGMGIKGASPKISGRNCRIALFPPKAVVSPSPKKAKLPPKRSRQSSIHATATALISSRKTVKQKSQKSSTPATVLQVAAYICPYCKLSFQHASLLITHLKRHSGDNPFKCPQCDQGFKQSRHLEMHMKQSHSKSKSKMTSTLPVPVVPNPPLEEVPEESESEYQYESQAESYSPSHQEDQDPDEVTGNSNLTMRRLELKQSAGAKKRAPIFAVKSEPPRYTTTSEPEPVDPESDGDFIKIRRFRCNYCGKTFLSADGVKTHIRTHTNERPYQCTHCPTRFTQKVHMEKHVRLIHQNNHNCKFRCTECQGGFQIQGNLMRHLKSAHDIPSSDTGTQSSKQVVAIANKVTTTKSFSQKRKINSSSQLTIKNKVVTTSKTFLKKRRKKQKFYYSNKYWSTARSQRKAPTTVTSSAVPIPASSSNNLIKWEERPKRDLLRSYVPLTRCDELVRIWMEKKRELILTSTSSLFRKRERKSQQQLPPAYFATKSKPKSSKAHSCSKNKRSHSSSPTKAKPQITEADRKNFPFQCTTCGKRLKTKYGLEEHERIHTGEKPYTCKFCGKGFARWNNHYIHLRVHTGIKPYKCSICHRAFSQKTTLNNHLRAHEKGTIRTIEKEDEY